VAVVAAALAVALAAPAQAERHASPAAKKKRKSCKRKAARRGRRYCVRRRTRRRRARESVVSRNPARTPSSTTPTTPQLPGSPTPLSRYVSVAAREWSLTLSRPVVATGSVTIELRNLGEDPHDLVLSPEGTHTPLASFPETGPGGLAKLGVNLAAGRYLLWCSLAGHEGAGMRATLRAGG
jgi:hypothetical protein